MQVGGLDRDGDHHGGGFLLSCEPVQVLGFERHRSAAIDPKCLVHARHHKEQTNAAGLDDIAQRIEPVVATGIRDQQGVGIGHFHKTCLTAARGGVLIARCIAAGQHHKRRERDETLAMRVQKADFFGQRTHPGRGVQRAQLGQAGDYIGLGGQGHGRSLASRRKSA